MIVAAVLFVATFLVGVLVSRVVVPILTRLEMFDDVNERSSHTSVVPRGGGIGILGVLLPGALAGWVFLGVGGLSAMGAGAVLLGAAILFGLGLFDDRKGARPAAKLLLQLCAAVLFVSCTGRIAGVSLPGGTFADLGVLAAPLTVFWLVGFSNGFNFMDGIDGIAALHAGVAALVLSAASLSGGGELLWLSIPVAGAAFSFLAVNWSPARVFMGDCGSLPLGFLLAGLAVIGSEVDRIPFVTSFLALGPFLFDALYTLARRVFRKENVLRAHRSHLYQRMVIAGWSHARVSLIYGGWTLLSGLFGILYLQGLSPYRGLAIAGGLAAGMLVVAVVWWLERAQDINGA